ncbi:MAG: AAA family ATPase [Sulfuricellaceae bacterium]|jgi:MSHA biogenesis protein MshM
MYCDFFGLSAPPFKITPNLELFYAGGKRGAILDALLYAVTSNEGIVKVVGEVGSGKTMLCRMLESRLPETVETIYIATPSLSRDEILYAIADELGLDLHELRAAQALRRLQEHLIDKYAQGRQVVVFIDEAQAMPLDTLEEIRLLSNLETGTHKLLQMILFGQPELDQHLRQTQIRQLRERITHSFELVPLAAPEIRDYLMFRLRAVGYRGPDIFSEAAIGLIARASDGLIRRANILADKSLLAAFADNSHEISKAHAQAAVRDSGLKPGRPWKKILIAATVLAGLLAAGAAAYNTIRLPAPRAVKSAPGPQPPSHQPPEPKADASPVSPPQSQTLLEKRLAATKKWLAEEDAGHYTLQAMATTNGSQEFLERAVQELGRVSGEDDVYIYPTLIQKKPGFSLAYGNFGSRAQAREALSRLPAAIQAKRPLLRSVGGIRAEQKSLPKGGSR